MEDRSKMRVTDFLSDTFVQRRPKVDEVISIDEITPTEPTKSSGSKAPRQTSRLEDRTTSSVIIQINRLLGAICILSFVAIILYPIINSTLKIPDVIPNTFSMTLGYFGSALLTYLERSKKNQD